MTWGRRAGGGEGSSPFQMPLPSRIKARVFTGRQVGPGGQEAEKRLFSGRGGKEGGRWGGQPYAAARVVPPAAAVGKPVAAAAAAP